ncbi:MAG: hypothetical protein C4586_09355 [Anaerolineaceae bacterium]|nr:MAG: hypothetical protein C4586_09355 [Anaerolineaceae bacterium]
MIMSEIVLKGRLDGRQRNKLNRLFDMLYTPKELAHEIEINIDQVYDVYVPFGCPHERDPKNHILINGKNFAEWYGMVYAKIHLVDDETFCKSCKKGVKIYQPKEMTKDGLVYWLSMCPICGRNLTKIISNKGRENDK